ncbi:uncharacterized protein LTR77_005697 [Saxophila tyrrhenica]|uniref:Uncharacterized protein n=1 Tax=Saxophila tyrrhenica TaxID=1690608 RepID=A0AAV9PCP2_9PEZI|nr:hypothetical protein LTR77_005697 [Saxophila tyrrhenica]
MESPYKAYWKKVAEDEKRILGEEKYQEIQERYAALKDESGLDRQVREEEERREQEAEKRKQDEEKVKGDRGKAKAVERDSSPPRSRSKQRLNCPPAADPDNPKAWGVPVPDAMTPKERYLDQQFRQLPPNLKIQAIRTERARLEGLLKDLCDSYHGLMENKLKFGIGTIQAQIRELAKERTEIDWQTMILRRRYDTITKDVVDVSWRDWDREQSAFESYAVFGVCGYEIRVKDAILQKHLGISWGDYVRGEVQALRKNYPPSAPPFVPLRPSQPFIEPTTEKAWVKHGDNVKLRHDSTIEDMEEYEDLYSIDLCFNPRGQVPLGAQHATLQSLHSGKDKLLDDVAVYRRDLEAMIGWERDREERKWYKKMLKKVNKWIWRVEGTADAAAIQFYTDLYERGFALDTSSGTRAVPSDGRPSFSPTVVAHPRSTATVVQVEEKDSETSSDRGGLLADYEKPPSEAMSMVPPDSDSDSESSTESSDDDAESQPGTLIPPPVAPGDRRAHCEPPQFVDAKRQESNMDQRKGANALLGQVAAGSQQSTRRKFNGQPVAVAGPSKQTPWRRQQENKGDYVSEDDMPKILAMIAEQEAREQERNRQMGQ